MSDFDIPHNATAIRDYLYRKEQEEKMLAEIKATLAKRPPHPSRIGTADRER